MAIMAENVNQRPGYKLTEVGIIPEDWEAKQIRDVCSLINGRGFKPHEWQTIGLPIIRIQNLNGSEDFNYFSGPYNPKILIEHGQLLFAWSGSRGTSFGPYVWNGGLALLNYHTWKVVINESRTNPHFLLHAFRQLTGYIETRAHGASALVHVQKWEMEKFLIPLPSSLLEQHAIATALSDVGALITSLDHLITKKHDIKQATMQLLLTGRRRLPGFSKGLKTAYKRTEVGVIPDDWEVHTLGDEIDRLEAGISVNSVDEDLHVSVYEQAILKTSSVSNGHFLPLESKKIAPRDIKRAKLNPRGDSIIISRMNTPDLVGECGYVDKDYLNLFLPDRLWMTHFKRESAVNAKWLNYLLSYKKYKSKIKSTATGTSGSMKNISKGSLLSINIPFPSPEEQQAIATVLSDMDAEIAALEHKREKTRMLKQGMMQELLTGKTRLL